MTPLLTAPFPTVRSAAAQAVSTPFAPRAFAVVAACFAVQVVIAMPLSPVAGYFSLPGSTTDIATHVQRGRGDRTFAWTGQIATYLLFVASTVFVLRNRWNLSRPGPCALAFGLHGASRLRFVAFPASTGMIPAL